MKKIWFFGSKLCINSEENEVNTVYILLKQIAWFSQHSLNKIINFLAVSLDIMSRRVWYTVRQILDKVFADEDSDYGPELECLTAKIRSKCVLDG